MTNYQPETAAVALGRPVDAPDAPMNTPVALTSTYIAGGEMAYARYGNPSWTALETTIGALEGGECLTFASGMAAAAAILSEVPHGARIVVPRHAYQGVLTLLKGFEESGRLVVTQVDVTDSAAFESAIPGAAMVWLETPTNPALEVTDIAAVVALAKPAGVPVVVDNTFATPLRQQPLAAGATVVLHSATKLLAGHSDVIMGATVTNDPDWQAKLLAYRSLHGAIAGPMEAFLALRGIRTLAVRLDRAEANAKALVRALSVMHGVEEVRYPGFGTIIAFVLADAATADRVVEATALVRHATSLGGVESTFERRRRWETEAPTIPEGLIRLSVGIEHERDVIADLQQAVQFAVAAR